MWRSAEAPLGTTTRSPWGRSLRLTLTGVALGLLALAPGLDAATTTKPTDGVLLDGAGGSTDSVLPASFTEDILFGGQLTNPAAVRFLADGRVFVAQKSGVIKVFDSLADTAPDQFADLSGNVHNFWDRGLLGLALDPAFTTGRPYVYVLYTYDAPIGGSPPTWGDACPTPPGATADGCVVSARLSRLDGERERHDGPEQVLINDWCQQYPSHSIGSLAFGADGMLYVSGGDGASFNFTDYGQDGTPLNPCGDPPGGAGATLTPPTAEGGALRSQDLRTTADPTGLDGAILRVESGHGSRSGRESAHRQRRPRTRAASSPTASGTRSGSRSGRARTRSGSATSVGTRGRRSTASPIHSERSRTSAGRATRATATPVGIRQREPLDLREPVRRRAARRRSVLHVQPQPRRSSRARPVPPGARRSPGWPSTRAAATRPRTADALFFADYSRDCIWVMFPGGNGLPDPANRSTFARLRLPIRSTCRSGRAATSSTPTSTAVRSDGSGTSARHLRHPTGTRCRLLVQRGQPGRASPTASGNGLTRHPDERCAAGRRGPERGRGAARRDERLRRAGESVAAAADREHDGQRLDQLRVVPSGRCRHRLQTYGRVRRLPARHDRRSRSSNDRLQAHEQLRRADVPVRSDGVTARTPGTTWPASTTLRPRPSTCTSTGSSTTALSSAPLRRPSRTRR